MARLVIKKKREGSLRRRHPWIFSGSVGKVEGSPAPGETVEIVTVRDELVARGAYSPQSQLVARVWSFDAEEEIDREFFRRRLQRALDARARTPEPGGARRLVNAESDGLPGLVVDRYGDWLVVQFLTAGSEHWRGVFLELLGELVEPAGIWERSDVDVRQKEGLQPRMGPAAGAEPPELVEIVEGPCRFLVDVRNGHKTGFYLDQRLNRELVAASSGGKELLNAFAYTGAFGVHAALAGASRVTHVESSPTWLELLERNVEVNGIDADRNEVIRGDVFQVLRTFRDSRREFDVIVLDPPKFAESKAQVKRASRGYKDINLLAFKLLRPGGRLFTYSCSAHVGPELFQKIVADAALDSGRDAWMVGRMFQAPDHRVMLPFPEGSYLKGLECTVE